MRKAAHTLKSGNYRLTIFDDGSTRKDRLAPAKIISINKTEAAKQTNTNGSVFWIATVEADFDGVKQVGPAIIWDAQLTTDKLPADTFAPGANISLAIQADGEYAGNASIELPGGSKFDLSTITAGMEVANDDFAKQVAALGLPALTINA